MLVPLAFIALFHARNNPANETRIPCSKPSGFKTKSSWLFFAMSQLATTCRIIGQGEDEKMW